MNRFDPSRTLFVSDMDGTLLDADSRLSPFTVATLNGLIARRGLLFTVATSRSTATVVDLMRPLRGALPYVVLSGAALWNPGTERFEDVQPLASETVRRVCAACEAHGVQPFVYRRHGDVIHVHHHGPLTPTEQAFVAARDGTPYKRYLPDDPGYHTAADETMLIYAMRHGTALERICADLRRLPCSPVCYRDIFDTRLALLEVYAPGCDKAAAVRRLARRIGADRVVAFGDNLNDMSMLKAADHAVAVGNAVRQVRECADEVIGPNTADSVARWLDSHVGDGE